MRRAWIGPEQVDFTYGECQEEMNMINKSLLRDNAWRGDSEGRPLVLPDTHVQHLLTDSIGITPSLMVCGRWQGSTVSILRQLYKLRPKGGGRQEHVLQAEPRPEGAEEEERWPIGSADSTGSIGVVTINLPRIAYESDGNLDKVLLNPWSTG